MQMHHPHWFHLDDQHQPLPTLKKSFLNHLYFIIIIHILTLNFPFSFLTATKYLRHKPVYPAQNQDWKAVFPDGTPIETDKRPAYVFVWKTWGECSCPTTWNEETLPLFLLYTPALLNPGLCRWSWRSWMSDWPANVVLAGQYWQVADGPSSSLTIDTDDIPLGSYTMDIVIYHYRSKEKFIPLGYASTQFSITGW